MSKKMLIRKKKDFKIDESFLNHINAEWTNRMFLNCDICEHAYDDHSTLLKGKTSGGQVVGLTYVYFCTLDYCDCKTVIES